MIIHYIQHSSFYLAGETADFLFDYVRGEIPVKASEKPLYVFCSHRHGDHFSPVIFSLAKEYAQVQFILSNDISKKRVPKELTVYTTFIGPNETLELDGMTIKTLKSTDEGVAFLIQTKDKVIYHGGDLNDWQWAGESQEINDGYRVRYRCEIDKLADIRIDYAFLPLDPRQEEYYADGMDWFLTHVEVSWAFPMHCWEDCTVIERYKNRVEAKEFRSRIIEKPLFKVIENDYNRGS